MENLRWNLRTFLGSWNPPGMLLPSPLTDADRTEPVSVPSAALPAPSRHLSSLSLPFVPVLSDSQLIPAHVCRNRLRQRLEVIC